MLYRAIYHSDNQVVYCDEDSGRFLIYDHTSRRIRFEALAPQLDYAGGLSGNGQAIALGYWAREGIDVWNVATGRRLTIPCPRGVGDVVLDSTGQNLAIACRAGVLAINRKSGRQIKVDHCERLDSGDLDRTRNGYLIPTKRKAVIARLRFRPLKVLQVLLDTPVTIRWLQCSPVDHCFCAIDTAKTVFLHDLKTNRTRWTMSLRKVAPTAHIGVGCFSGNGRLIGFAACEHSYNHVIVLDANTGTIRDHFSPSNGATGYPFRKTHVLFDESVKKLDPKATAYNLMTGKEDKVQLGEP